MSICPVVFYQCFGEERVNFVLSQPKCKPAHFLQTNQLKLKRETKVSQEEAFLSLYLVIKTITLHCKVVSSKLLENLFHTAQIYQYSILQLNHQKYLWKLVPFEPCQNILDCSLRLASLTFMQGWIWLLWLNFIV